ncbi:hypothetical protein [Dyella flagellata]|uniref:Serine/threonine protein kinase n=1 Tax=Dyella flagellata TaxID=1867833 RepID=A0ABQ5X8H5_9GAMM|nr:hypothetical protein [Dyella flagellata]GLQ87956.1 hypothetical protein GCM10007898_15240 [Dyella flagellata]
MELDDMKLAWQTLGRQWETQHALNIQLLTERRLDQARHGLWPLFWGQLLQIVAGALVAVMAVSFWFPRMTVLHFLVWGLSVHVFGIVMIVTAARNLHLIKQIDYAAPVLEIQRRIASLRAWRVHVEAPLYAVTCSFVWIPLVLMAIASSGVDPEDAAPALTSYLLLSGFASLGLVALVAWLIRRWGYRAWLENSLAGGGVQKAETMLEQITRFQQE